MAVALNPNKLTRLEDQVGVLELTQTGGAKKRKLDKYRNDPVGFATDVLGVQPWEGTKTPGQRGTMTAVLEHAMVAVKGANAVGKDAAAGWLALWWAYARGGRCIITGPTQRQVDEIVFGQEIRQAWTRAELPGELWTRKLQPEGAGEWAQIIGFVSTDVSKLSGFHAPEVLIIVTEAQGVGDDSWEAIFGTATGDEDRFLVVGNPLEPTGKFHAAFLPGAQWHPITLPATDHPNIVQCKTVIRGGPTMASLERMRREFGGEGSRYWQGHVEAEFPSSATDTLIPRHWVEAAFGRWDGSQDAMDDEPVVGLDIARTGGDLCVAAPVRGRRIHPVTTWEPDPTNPTRDAVTRAEKVMLAHGGRPDRESLLLLNGVLPPELELMFALDRRPPRGRFIVDVALMGGGVVDGLRERGWDVVEFNGSSHERKRDADDPDRFENDRAFCYWDLRKAFERNIPAVARDERLAEELVATRYEDKDQVKMVRKPEIRAALGRSPDRADAVMMSWAEANSGGVSEGGSVVSF